MPKKLTTEKFIEKAREVHGNKYDYSKVEYIKNNIDVCIICPIHGEFQQKPQYHLSGRECYYCGINKIKENKKYTTEIFIEKAKKVHGNKYDYSKVEYNGSNENVCIICPKHGKFLQTPAHHLSGQGCKDCSYDYKSQVRRKEIDTFINEAEKIHGNKYDYSKSEYINETTEICIICHEHGEFYRKPVSHLYKKAGCPICTETIGEGKVREFLTKNNINFEAQKTFDWLKNVSKLSLDFYLPDYNIAIEYQGEQHFRPVKFFGGCEKFNKQTKNDKIKKELCEKHGIKIFYYSELDNIDISYKVFTTEDELITEIKNSTKKY